MNCDPRSWKSPTFAILSEGVLLTVLSLDDFMSASVGAPPRKSPAGGDGAFCWAARFRLLRRIRPAARHFDVRCQASPPTSLGNYSNQLDRPLRRRAAVRPTGRVPDQCHSCRPRPDRRAAADGSAVPARKSSTRPGAAGSPGRPGSPLQLRQAIHLPLMPCANTASSADSGWPARSR